MAARKVHKAEFNRALEMLKERGETLTALDLLPGGALRLHVVPPAGTLPEPAQEAREAAEWDAALA